jgi:hypothetical protein
MSVYIVWILSNISDIPHKKVVSMLNVINAKSEQNPCPMNTLNVSKGVSLQGMIIYNYESVCY